MSNHNRVRHPECGCAVVRSIQQRVPVRTPETVSAETDRFLRDMELRSQRQWGHVIKAEAGAVAIILIGIVILWAIGG